MKKVVVVIPIYKVNPQIPEQASFRQCLSVLGKYDITLLTYKELDTSVYEMIAKEFDCALNKVYFSKDFFMSKSCYSRLCLNPKLYKGFLEYQYMLIYQLDAWVFRDELESWCDKGYDYIGAPWFEEDGEGFSYDFVEGVGNGGLSLRKVAFCYKVLCRFRYAPILPIREILRRSKSHNLRLIKACVKSLGVKNNLSYYQSGFDGNTKNEDGYFSLFRNSYVKCNIPSSAEALGFSFEVHPSYLFLLNNKLLPFGCHAYRKNEYDTFWSKYIDDNG